MGVFGVWVAMVIDWVVRVIFFELRYCRREMENNSNNIRRYYRGKISLWKNLLLLRKKSCKIKKKVYHIIIL